MPLETPPGETRRLTPRALLWSTVAFSAAWGLGAIVDVRYHAHSGFEIESFITLTHALLYGGVTGVVLLSLAYLFESWRLGERRQRWLPPGFALVLGGALAFLAVGGLDAMWHYAFGFEADLEALLSPTHLALLVARIVSNVGLLRAALHYRSPLPRTRIVRVADVPAALTIGFVLGSMHFAAYYTQPLVVDYAALQPVATGIHFVEGIDREQFTARIAGTAGVMLHSMLMALFLVGTLRRLRLPVGALTIILLYLGLTLVAIADMWRYLPALLLAAVVGELIWGSVQPDDREHGARRRLWLLGAAVPFTLTAAYFTTMAVGGGILWTVHLWAGIPFVAALFGLATAMLVVPPAFFDEDVDDATYDRTGRQHGGYAAEPAAGRQRAEHRVR